MGAHKTADVALNSGVMLSNSASASMTLPSMSQPCAASKYLRSESFKGFIGLG
jgi:hypothetical protein